MNPGRLNVQAIIPAVHFKFGVLLLKLLSGLVLAIVTSGFAAEEVSTPDKIVDNYCTATQSQQQSLGASMEVEIQASLPKLKKHGRLHALRRISKLGRITYERFTFEGDGTVKNQVVARYLTAEVEAHDEQARELALTPANYKFGYKTKSVLDGRTAYVFTVSPRTKRVGLFKGELWIDTATYLPLQESGYWVKNPSIFLKKVAFVRKFKIRDGISVPLQVASIVDTRVWGPAELEIDFTNFSPDAVAADEGPSSVAGDDDSQ